MPKSVEEITILPCYSEDGSTLTLVIDRIDGIFLTSTVIADALRGYASLLEEQSHSESERGFN